MMQLEKRDVEKQKVRKFIISSIVESNIRYLQMDGAEEKVRLIRRSSEDIITRLDDQVIIEVRLSIIPYKEVLTDLMILQKQIIEDIRLLTGLRVGKVVLKIEHCSIDSIEKT